MAFTVNYVIGSGILGIPFAFVSVGVGAATVVTLIFLWLCNITKDYLLEGMSRAEALRKYLDRTVAAAQAVGPEAMVADPNFEVPTPALAFASRPSLGGEDAAGSGVLADERQRTPEPEQDSAAHPLESILHTTNGVELGTSVDWRNVARAAAALGVRWRRRDFHLDEGEGNHVEVGELTFIFLGKVWGQLYTVMLCLYLGFSCWGYAAVFASSFAANVPTWMNAGATCDIESEPGSCLGPYLFFIVLFTAATIPMAISELREQLSVQIVMFFARVLVILLLVLSVLSALGCDGTAFRSVGENPPVYDKFFIPKGLAVMVPVGLFAFIFHHSVPIIAAPAANKDSLASIFFAALCVCVASYIAVGGILALYFGTDVKQQVNLNFQSYVGCVPVGHGLPPTTPPGAMLVAFVVLIFPAVDVMSVFPLCAVALGNAMAASMLSPELLAETKAAATDKHAVPLFCKRRFCCCGRLPVADPPAPHLTGIQTPEGASPAHAGALELEADQPASCYGSLPSLPAAHPAGPIVWRSEQMRRGWMVKTGFRLLASVPPIVGAMVVHDLGQILAAAGTIGIFITFVFPALIAWASHRMVVQAGSQLEWQRSSGEVAAIAMPVGFGDGSDGEPDDDGAATDEDEAAQSASALRAAGGSSGWCGRASPPAGSAGADVVEAGAALPLWRRLLWSPYVHFASRPEASLAIAWLGVVMFVIVTTLNALGVGGGGSE